MKKIYVFDIDNTVCSWEIDYNEAQPFLDRIEKINKLYDEGNTIIFDSARGTKTGVDWYEITKKQLENWGVKYHTLRTGVKFAGDIFIDDRGVSDKDFFN